MAIGNSTVAKQHDNTHSAKSATTRNESSVPDSDNGSSEYFIDPIKERRMMRKFDASAKPSTDVKRKKADPISTALRNHGYGCSIHDVQSRSKQLGKCQYRRNARGYWACWQPIWHSDNPAVSLHALPFASPLTSESCLQFRHLCSARGTSCCASEIDRPQASHDRQCFLLGSQLSRNGYV